MTRMEDPTLPKNAGPKDAGLPTSKTSRLIADFENSYCQLLTLMNSDCDDGVTELDAIVSQKFDAVLNATRSSVNSTSVLVQFLLQHFRTTGENTVLSNRIEAKIVSLIEHKS